MPVGKSTVPSLESQVGDDAPTSYSRVVTGASCTVAPPKQTSRSNGWSAETAASVGGPPGHPTATGRRSSAARAAVIQPKSDAGRRPCSRSPQCWIRTDGAPARTTGPAATYTRWPTTTSRSDPIENGLTASATTPAVRLELSGDLRIVDGGAPEASGVRLGCRLITIVPAIAAATARAAARSA